MTNRDLRLIIDILCLSILRKACMMSAPISSLMKYRSIVSTVRFVNALSDSRSFIMVLCMRMAIF